MPLAALQGGKIQSLIVKNHKLIKIYQIFSNKFANQIILIKYKYINKIFQQKSFNLNYNKYKNIILFNYLLIIL